MRPEIISTHSYHGAKKNYKELDENLAREDLKLSIIRGAEVVLNPQLLAVNNLKKLCIGDTDYMLVEFPWGQYPYWVHDLLFQLGLNNIIPILAHPERNKEIYRRYNDFSRLIDSGLFLQINAINLLKRGMCRKLIKRLFNKDSVVFIATDTHLPDQNLTCFKNAINVAAKEYGKDRMERIIHNSSLMLENKVIYN